ALSDAHYFVVLLLAGADLAVGPLPGSAGSLRPAERQRGRDSGDGPPRRGGLRLWLLQRPMAAAQLVVESAAMATAAFSAAPACVPRGGGPAGPGVCPAGERGCR